ncbi:MAG: hypothetical protein JXC32_16910, partial [Anaerolineae bacterium]|nr:hypothetical protein [Anaerolineae bacterium]
MTNTQLPMTLVPAGMTKGLKQVEGEALIPGAVWYETDEVGGGLTYTFPEGTLAAAQYLSADWLLDGSQLVVFVLHLQEGDDGPIFRLTFGFLNQCSARMRVPLEAVNQNRWRYPREGAWLKPLCGGDRVDLRKVDRMRIEVLRKGAETARFCVTPVTASVAAPSKLDRLILPKGVLLDELGQSALHAWRGRTSSADVLTTRLEGQLADAPAQQLPEPYSRWGGWKARQVEATGFFRTHHDGERWWLVDPDGFLFWSSGLDCVRFSIDSAYEGLEDALLWLPEPGDDYDTTLRAGEWTSMNYLKANFIRAFGPEEAEGNWATIVLSQLRSFGFNTVANWSDWEIARGKMPYTRPMDTEALHMVPNVYRDFPDVYHPAFQDAAAAFAEQLASTVDDPAFMGYFLMNEPTWGFAQETPAAGMLYSTETCYAREALVGFLQERYAPEQALSEAWGFEVSFDEIGAGRWQRRLTEAAEADLAAFSEKMVVRYFGTLSEACRRVDPHHLNLGIRYQSVPPAWAVEGMRTFDVFS